MISEIGIFDVKFDKEIQISRKDQDFQQFVLQSSQEKIENINPNFDFDFSSTKDFITHFLISGNVRITIMNKNLFQFQLHLTFLLTTQSYNNTAVET